MLTIWRFEPYLCVPNVTLFASFVGGEAKNIITDDSGAAEVPVRKVSSADCEKIKKLRV
jgi:hypothetical protein